jgi:Ca2+-binding RTX toxin-like protein
MAAKEGVRHALMLAGAASVSFAVFGMCLAPRASALTRCSYEGAPENVLTVTTDGALAEITRRGQQIVVREYLERPRTCSGGVPTVFNTDTIRVLVDPGGFADLLLKNGPFLPGATPELEGSSEIEVEFIGDDIYVAVDGTSSADQFEWGPGRDRHAGLNFNPGAAGDEDVDVTVEGVLSFLNAVGRGGNDSIVPAPGALFPNDAVFSTGGHGDDRLVVPRNSGGLLEGGPGDDVLIGGRHYDELNGGRGNDRLVGGAGPDRIDVIAGDPRGRDLILAGPGRDQINSRDSDRDRVRCGAGRDRVTADRRDRLRGCEAVRR